MDKRSRRPTDLQYNVFLTADDT